MTGRRFEKLLPLMFFIFLGFCIADLLVLNFRDQMLPNKSPPARPKKPNTNITSSRDVYNTIISRNIFNSDGTIPDPLVGAGKEKKPQQDAEPILSLLPLTLAGTIVHSNPEKSIANIELKGKNSVLAYTPNRDIDKIATLLKVERNKVYIRNLNNSRVEFLEMKSTAKISFTGAKASAIPVSNEVAQVAPNKFEIKRSDVMKYTQDMATVLQQAAMVPKRNTKGEIEGFKFLSIQPGSIFTQLGFQNGDTIKEVNGNAVTSPAQAMEMYQALKEASSIKLKRERDGRDEEVDYTIK